MKDSLDKILLAAAGIMLAVTLAAVALAAGARAFGDNAGGAGDAPLLALAAGVAVASAARGIRRARAASGGAASRRAVAARGGRLGSLVRHPGW